MILMIIKPITNWLIDQLFIIYISIISTYIISIPSFFLSFCGINANGMKQIKRKYDLKKEWKHLKQSRHPFLSCNTVKQRLKIAARIGLVQIGPKMCENETRCRQNILSHVNLPNSNRAGRMQKNEWFNDNNYTVFVQLIHHFY